MKKIGDYTLPRGAVYGVCIFFGILVGVVNSFLELDFSFRPALFGWLIAAIVIVVILHEGIHGTVAAVLGHKPEFGLKPPLVYITFSSRIPRGHFTLVALAPFIVLDIVFGFLYVQSVLKLFSNFCFTINTIGAVGDVWIAVRLLNTPKGAEIQDTKTGFEIWVPDKM